MKSKGAMYKIGHMHMYTTGRQNNTVKAFKYWTKAVELGHTPSMIMIGHMYSRGCEGIEKDTKEGFKFYNKAAELGNPGGINALAYAFHNAAGVKMNIPKAIMLYKKAVELGNSASMNNLAHLYLFGKHGVKLNVTKAIKLYERSIELGHAPAMYNLACVYNHGNSVIKINVDKAIEYYKKALKLGHVPSIVELITIFKNSKANDSVLECLYSLYMIEKNESPIRKFITENNVEWRSHYHLFWSLKDPVSTNSLILRILLISKHLTVITKGIGMMIIKHLCHFDKRIQQGFFISLSL